MYESVKTYMKKDENVCTMNEIERKRMKTDENVRKCMKTQENGRICMQTDKNI